MNPALINLLVFAGVVIAIWLAYRFFSSRNPLESRINQQKTITEDILKQLYHVEQSKSSANLDNLAGALQLSRRKIYPVIETMTGSGLINLHDNQIELTEEGRQYALKIIRIHRLWEKYLAERTGHKASEWHHLAEKMEHKISEEEAQKLESFLGNPMFDPHGDPIPSESGEMNKVKWVPLPSFEMNQPCKITHIEDEPGVIYQQILENKLFVGSHVMLLQKDNNEVSFVCEGEEHRFSTIVAANIHVEALSEDEIFEENAVRLSALQYGETAEVIGLSKECRGANRRRLLDLGILPGTKVEVDLKSPLQDPVAYRVRNTSIALRNTLADLILINKS
ncbi:DtxR family transcriptional regulator [Roseivirga sp.]|uniref:metal-dependent transcriptional regulator n=1 Tax=Roseivirga sp. TaxID=1964215 RepID=UPI003B527A21